VPDLAFTENTTWDEFGQARNLSFESQLENLDLNLYTLFAQMKKENIWNHTNIYLLGLNGHSDIERKIDKPLLNMHSEQTQVSLFIKPSGKPRDEGIFWSYDAPVCLADIGATLSEFFGATLSPKNTQTPVVSLLKDLEKPTSIEKRERWIYSESTWGPWKNLGPMMYSLRNDDLLFIHDAGEYFYNTLTDKPESSEISTRDSTVASAFAEIEKIRSSLNFEPPLSSRKSTDTNAQLDMQVQKILHAGDWHELKKLGHEAEKTDWVALAERNLGEDKISFENPCLRLLDKKNPTSSERKSCNDRKVLALLDVVNTDPQEDPAQKEIVKRKLSFLMKDENLFLDIAQTNFNLGLIWNLSETMQQQSDLLQLALHHPKVSGFTPR
jgi:hypothetical protein